jgi:hypothetical protein
VVYHVKLVIDTALVPISKSLILAESLQEKLFNAISRKHAVALDVLADLHLLKYY